MSVAVGVSGGSVHGSAATKRALAKIKRLKAAIDKGGLELTQLQMLLTIADHPQGISITDIATKTGLATSSVSRSVQLFADRGRGKTSGLGLLEIFIDPFAPKFRHVRLSQAGKDTIAEVIDALN